MAELIAKSSIIAVTDELTTLLDWTNIEQVSAFTIVVNNAGGGSADALTDIQIDTSDDAGVTSLLDQHAGVPAVPIAAAAASQGTFTETAKYIRVRAICAEGDDTTATAILFADTSIARICTLADVKDRLGLTSIEHDANLCRIITGIEAVFNDFCRRIFIAPAADVTEYHTGEGGLLSLERYPIISVTSIKESADYSFALVDALTADTDYRIIASGRSGIIYRIYAKWLEVMDCIEIIYRGGYCSAGQVPGTGEYALPSDLREAAVEQSSFIFKRRDDLGLSSVGFQGGSIQKFADMDLLPLVKEILSRYRRPSL